METDSAHVAVLKRARAADPSWTASDLAALEGAVAHFAARADPASALELFARAWRASLASGHIDAGRRVAGLALGLAGGRDVEPWYCRALYADGVLAFRAGDDGGSLERNTQALAIAHRTADVQGEAEALTGLARVALREGDYPRVIAHATRARDIARGAADASLEAGPLHLHAAGVRLMKDYAGARDLYTESLALFRRLGNGAGMSMEEHNLGWVSIHLGDAAAAEGHFARAAESAVTSYARAWRTLNSAAVSFAQGRLAEAREAYASGKAQLDALQQALDPDDRFELEWMAAQLGSTAHAS